MLERKDWSEIWSMLIRAVLGQDGSSLQVEIVRRRGITEGRFVLTGLLLLTVLFFFSSFFLSFVVLSKESSAMACLNGCAGFGIVTVAL